MAKKKKRTGLYIIVLICGMLIGAAAVVMGMKILNKNIPGKAQNPDVVVDESVNAVPESTQQGQNPEDPIPTDETNIAVITVGDQKITMQEINVYLYQLRDFYTSQYGESPWSKTMDDGTLLQDYAKNELFNGLVRTEVLNAKASEFNVSLSDEEKQKCKEEAAAYIAGLGEAITKDFALTENGVCLMKEKQALSTKVYNAALEQLSETAEDTSEEGLAAAFEKEYETWKSEYEIKTDPIWDNIVIGSVG